MSEGNIRKVLAGLAILGAMTCGIVILAAYSLLSGRFYDPKQAAEETLVQCLDGSKEICGYVTSSQCWADVQQVASQVNNPYSIDVIWYNWEDEICCRGGDEVYMQIEFSSGDAFKLLWYEGTIEQCEVVAPHLQTSP